MAKMIHSMVRVQDEASSLAFYRAAFGLEMVDRYPLDGFTLLYLRNGEQDFELELTVNAGRDRPYELGDGYGHIAVSVPDIEAEHARFEAEGLKPTPLKALAHEGKPLARFFFVSDPDGYRIEVLQRDGRFI
jgi:lactoylglutathione lyase